ncbi:MAG TPA: tRNA pseudouridine(38-40) synthase TruA [Anaeromyxobacteraceae bacterium]|nr:tRNA pseudouridine(38-40) synthase TruA [Anaeromyxobacteraceae bacterium]
MEKRRYALRLAYDGRAFRGFQRQPGLPTVQEALTRALSTLGIRSRLDAAARTDAGVHALGQVVGFATRADLDPEALRAAVNRETPAELMCLEARPVPRSFHPRASATSRRYLYLVGLPPPAEVAPYAWALPDERAFPGVAAQRLDAAAMREAFAGALGEHDFRGFARPGEQRRTVRTLTRAEVIEASCAPLYAVVLEGRGFLRAMARNLVGTAVTAGLGLASPERLAERLAAGQRYRGVRAPGWGLTLVSVSYPGGAWAG